MLPQTAALVPTEDGETSGQQMLVDTAPSPTVTAEAIQPLSDGPRGQASGQTDPLPSQTWSELSVTTYSQRLKGKGYGPASGHMVDTPEKSRLRQDAADNAARADLTQQLHAQHVA